MDLAKFIDKLVAKFIGTKHERDIKRMQPLVAQINVLEPEMQKLTDAGIGGRTIALRAEPGAASLRCATLMCSLSAEWF